MDDACGRGQYRDDERDEAAERHPIGGADWSRVVRRRARFAELARPLPGIGWHGQRLPVGPMSLARGDPQSSMTLRIKRSSRSRALATVTSDGDPDPETTATPIRSMLL
jgi:hypothetical protein